MVSVDSNRRLSIHKWRELKPDMSPSFLFQPDSIPPDQFSVGVPFATHAATTYGESKPVICWMFSVHPSQPWLFPCGHWDCSIRVTQLSDSPGKCIQCVVFHQDIVTCLALSEDGAFLGSGSSDATVAIWKIEEQWSRDEKLPVSSSPLHRLYGHDDTVTCVAIVRDLDMVISSGKDGSVIVHTLFTAQYVRTIIVDPLTSQPSPPCPVAWCRTWCGQPHPSCLAHTYRSQFSELEAEPAGPMGSNS